MTGAARGAFHIEFRQEAQADLRSLTADQRERVRDGVQAFLLHQPDVEPKNRRRRRLRPNHVAGWRLRVDPLRVYYDIDAETRTVTIQAVMIKDRGKLYRRGREVTLDERDD